MDSLDARLISGTDKDSARPFFSPDGQWIGYVSESDQKLKKVAISGGAPVVLCDIGVTVYGASWYPEDTIVYSNVPSGIMRVSSNGGTPETLIKASLENLAIEGFPIVPQILPDGKTLLFTQALDSVDTTKMQIEIQSLESGERKVLVRGGAYGRYLPSGHIVYKLENNLFAVPFDLDKLAVTGGQVSTLENVGWGAFSNSGTLVYVPQTAAAAGSASTALSANTLVWVDRNGKEEPLGAAPNVYSSFKISPDGKCVALTVLQNEKSDVWIWDMARETPTRLTFSEGSNSTPIWTLDGKRVIYRCIRGGPGICWKAADGTGSEEQLFSSPTDLTLAPYSFSKDGKTLVLGMASTSTLSIDVGMLSMEGDHSRKPLLQEKYDEDYPMISPDGRWLAYQSRESGKYEVYVRSYPDVEKGGRWQVSTTGGDSPLWSPDGSELFYRSGDSYIAVNVEREPAFSSGKPRVLFKGTYYSNTGSPMQHTYWDISPDGKRFLMIKPPAAPKSTTEKPAAPPPQPKINIILNWFEELKDRVPVD
jgi:serine/threonine-protein kinase